MTEEIDDKLKFHTGKVSIIAFSHVAHDIYPAFLAPLLPVLIDNLSLSYSLGGVLILLLRFPSVLNPLFGIISDKFGLKFFVIVTPFLTGLAMSFVPVVDNFYLLCAVLLLAGLSSAAYHVPGPVIIRYYSGSRIGTGMSFFMLAGESARTLGPLIILGFIGWFGAENSYMLASIGLTASVIIYFQLRNVETEKPDKNKDHIKGMINMIRQFRKLFLVIGGLLLSKSFIVIALTSFLPTFLTNRGEKLWIAGISLSVLELAGAAGAFTSGTLSDKIGRKNMLLIINVLAPIVLLVFINVHGWWVFPLLIVLGFLVFSATPVLMALVLENRTDLPATANSIYMTLNFVIGSVVALSFGIIGDIISLKSTYYLSAALALLGILFVFLIPEESKTNKK